MKNRLHVFLQSKGGVGKTLCSSVLGEYLDAHCFDVDPANATLHGFGSLKVDRLVVTSASGTQIDRDRFDDLIDALESSNAADIIIDSGSSAYFEWKNYLNAVKVPQYLSDRGVELWLHVVLVATNAKQECLDSVEDVLSDFPKRTRILVWENPYFGEIVDGDVTLTEWWQVREKRLKHVKLPFLDEPLFRKAFEAMQEKRLTFADVLEERESLWPAMRRRRVEMMRNSIWESLAGILPRESEEASPSRKSRVENRANA